MRVELNTTRVPTRFQRVVGDLPTLLSIGGKLGTRNLNGYPLALLSREAQRPGWSTFHVSIYSSMPGACHYSRSAEYSKLKDWLPRPAFETVAPPRGLHAPLW